MSDPVNPFTQQAPDTAAPDASATTGAEAATPGVEASEASATTGADQQAYGQQAYGQPMYAVNPAVEKIRSNASTARLLAILSFVFGGLLLSGGMWIWADNMLQEAQAIGAPIDVLEQARSAQSTAKICSIIHIAFIIAGLLIGAFVLVLGLMVASTAGR
mgnify:FL=1